MTEDRMKVACECGDWSGEPCGWAGPFEETVVVEYMPEQFRASHLAAGNSGVYPHNGAKRLRVSMACGDLMVEHDPEWAHIQVARTIEEAR